MRFLKTVTRHKEGHHNDQGINPKEDVTIINYAPNIGTPQYIRQMLTIIKEEINGDTIIERDFNTSLTLMDRSS